MGCILSVEDYVVLDSREVSSYSRNQEEQVIYAVDEFEATLRGRKAMVIELDTSSMKASKPMLRLDLDEEHSSALSCQSLNSRNTDSQVIGSVRSFELADFPGTPANFSNFSAVGASNYVTAINERLIKIGKLGEGSSAEVFKAIDICSLKLVALKVISYDNDVKAHSLFYHEIAALRSQRSPLLQESFGDDSTCPPCPYICRFYGCMVNELKKQASIAMEYECCGSLDDWATSGLPTPEPWLAHIAFSVLQALDFINKNLNRVHRDVKPGNILLSDLTQGTMTVKLADFGIAVSATPVIRQRNCSDLTGEFENKLVSPTGTRRFMAPERLALEGYSFNSDIWSVGLTLATAANKGKCPLPYAENEFDQLGVALIADTIVCGDGNNIKGQISTWDENLRSLLTNIKLSFEPSNSFRSFLKMCLTSDSKCRPGVADMLQHEFLQQRIAWEYLCPEVLLSAEQQRRKKLDDIEQSNIISMIAQARSQRKKFETVYSAEFSAGLSELSRDLCTDELSLSRHLEEAQMPENCTSVLQIEEDLWENNCESSSDCIDIKHGAYCKSNFGSVEENCSFSDADSEVDELDDEGPTLSRASPRTPLWSFLWKKNQQQGSMFRRSSSMDTTSDNIDKSASVPQAFRESSASNGDAYKRLPHTPEESHLTSINKHSRIFHMWGRHSSADLLSTPIQSLGLGSFGRKSLTQESSNSRSKSSSVVYMHAPAE